MIPALSAKKAVVGLCNSPPPWVVQERRSSRTSPCGAGASSPGLQTIAPVVRNIRITNYNGRYTYVNCIQPQSKPPHYELWIMNFGISEGV